jgi:hypothetical protein
MAAIPMTLTTSYKTPREREILLDVYSYACRTLNIPHEPETLPTTGLIECRDPTQDGYNLIVQNVVADLLDLEKVGLLRCFCAMPPGLEMLNERVQTRVFALYNPPEWAVPVFPSHVITKPFFWGTEEDFKRLVEAEEAEDGDDTSALVLGAER